MYTHLPWDSKFFNFNIAKIELEKKSANLFETLFFLKKEGYTLVYGFSKVEINLNSKLLKKFSGKLVDRKITYIKSVKDDVNSFYDSKIQKYEINKVNSNLLKLAIQSGEYSRFKLDKKISRNKFEELYKHWLINSINKKIADDVFIYSDNGVSGFITLANKNKNTDIGLIAVEKQKRGKGIGKILMQSAEIWAAKNSFSKIQVVTQEANLKACNFYEKCNYSVYRKDFIYHFWLK